MVENNIAILVIGNLGSTGEKSLKSIGQQFEKSLWKDSVFQPKVAWILCFARTYPCCKNGDFLRLLRGFCPLLWGDDHLPTTLCAAIFRSKYRVCLHHSFGEYSCFVNFDFIFQHGLALWKIIHKEIDTNILGNDIG